MGLPLRAIVIGFAVDASGARHRFPRRSRESSGTVNLSRVQGPVPRQWRVETAADVKDVDQKMLNYFLRRSTMR